MDESLEGPAAPTITEEVLIDNGELIDVAFA